MSKKKIISFIALVLVVLLWGVVPVLGKYLFNNNFYSPALLVAVRGLIATVLMAIFIIITKQYFNRIVIINTIGSDRSSMAGSS